MTDFPAFGVEKSTDNNFQASASGRPLPRSSRRRSLSRKRQQSTFLYLLLGAAISFLCVSLFGFIVLRGGYLPSGVSNALTATAIAQKNASCQVLIDKAIQASDNFCSNTSTNNVCYGNTTIQAELAPNTSERFSERGDMIPVDNLRRLSASPLKLESDEWGIAVFKVIANLPRSLPGETVTMVVFGNSTLENDSVNGGLESFYFTSELGQITCEKVPFDGMMVTAPDGTGVQFMINGAELTLTGNASINALKNGQMEINLYKGSARVVSNGVEQYFGAGQSVSVNLGGPNGNQAISPPSDPSSLSEEDMQVACTLLGKFCTQVEITPISEDVAQQEIEGQITSTPTLIPTQTLTPTLTSTIPPTNTLLVLPTSTPTASKTFTPTNTKPPTLTPIPSSTFTKTNTPTSPTTSMCGSVSTTPLNNPNANELATDITNNTGGPITITEFFAYWVKSPTSQKLDKLFLNGSSVWNISDNTSPSSIPDEGNWQNSVNLTIPNGATQNFVAQFQNDLQASGYEFHIIFDIGCQVVRSK